MKDLGVPHKVILLNNGIRNHFQDEYLNTGSSDLNGVFTSVIMIPINSTKQFILSTLYYQAQGTEKHSDEQGTFLSSWNLYLQYNVEMLG